MDNLVQKVETWVSQGVVTLRTARKILAAEGIDADDALHAQSGKRVVSLVSVLGAVLVGLGILLFIGTNWPEFSPFGKLGIIASIVALFYAGGYYLRYVKNSHEKLAAALFLIGGISYGAGIFLVSQIFHTDANPRELFLLWGAGLLPLVLFLREEPLFVLSSIVLAAWSLAGVSDGSFFWLFFEPDASGSPNYWYLFAWFFVLLPIAFRFGFKKGYAANLLGLLVWFCLAVVLWQESGGDILVPTLLSLFFLGINLIFIGRILDLVLSEFKGFWFLTRLFGGIAVVASAYLFSWNGILFFHDGAQPLSGISFAVFLVLVVSAFVLFALYMMRMSSEADPHFVSRREGAVLGLIAFCGLIFYLFPVSQEYTDTYETFHPFVLVWNAVLLALNILSIVVGYFERHRILINFGILFFVIHVVSRYFDVFALRLGTSFSFIAGGILLLGLSVALERFRKNLISKMERQDTLPDASNPTQP